MLSRKCLLVLTSLLLVSASSLAETPGHLWSDRYGDGLWQMAESVALDGSGNIIVTGYFDGRMSFGGPPLMSTGDSDMFLAKLDPYGNHIWSKSFGEVGEQIPKGALVDPAGNIILTGYFEGTVDFGGGTLTSAGDRDIFLVKLDADGNHIWSRRFGDLYDQRGISVALDGAGNVIITGDFRWNFKFGNRTLRVGLAFVPDIFVAKFAPNGNHMWSKRFGDANADQAFDIAVGGAGDIIVVGSYYDGIYFGGDPLHSAGMEDIFVAKLAPNGNHRWSKRFGDSESQYAWAVAVAELGHIYVTGSFTGTVNFGGDDLTSGGGEDIYLAKFAGNGPHIWSQSFGDLDEQSATDIDIDGSGNVVMTGLFQNMVNFGGATLTSAGVRDVFVAKFAADGNHIWSDGFGDRSHQHGISIAADNPEGFVATGSFEFAVDFGGEKLRSEGGYDVFLARFGVLRQLDIKPASCPNPFNAKTPKKPPKSLESMKGGTLEAAILGTAEKNVYDIDVSTLRLEGVAPRGHVYQDVAAPVDNEEKCACTTAGADGILDLVLKFRKSDIAATIEDASKRDMITLTLVGQLHDGSWFGAGDCVKIVGDGIDPPPRRKKDFAILRPASPNPFNPSTRIRYYLPREEFVTVSVYDGGGRLVENLISAVRPAGDHVVDWNAWGAASGVYFCRLVAGDFVESRKIILIK